MKFAAKVLKLANDNVTVALSMGADSLAITHFLLTKWPRLKISAFHYNHNLRDQNNVMMQKAVNFCQDYGIKLVLDTRPSDCTEGVSEASLRTLRYDAMSGLGHVITGHHLDDAVENYMFNCFNGVPEYLPIPLITEYTDKDLTIIRPFILSEKAEFLEYVNDNNLTKYLVEDETNGDTNYRRNWLRKDIIPAISEKGYNLKTIVKKMYNKRLKKM